MKAIRWLALGVVLSVPLAPALAGWHSLPTERHTADDLKELKGEWVSKAVTFDGDDVGADVASRLTYTFDGDKLTTKGGLAKIGDTYIAIARKDTYKVTLGVDDKLKTIDLKEDKEGGRTIPGIYKLEKGKFTIVLNYKNNERPKEFKGGSEGSGIGMFECEK